MQPLAITDGGSVQKKKKSMLSSSEQMPERKKSSECVNVTFVGKKYWHWHHLQWYRLWNYYSSVLLLIIRLSVHEVLDHRFGGKALDLMHRSHQFESTSNIILKWWNGLCEMSSLFLTFPSSSTTLINSNICTLPSTFAHLKAIQIMVEYC